MHTFLFGALYIAKQILPQEAQHAIRHIFMKLLVLCKDSATVFNHFVGYVPRDACPILPPQE